VEKDKNQKFIFLFGGEKAICLFSEGIEPNLLYFQLTMQWLSDAVFHWAKQPQREADHSFFVVLLSG
jgi:hypothetical protein